MKSDAIFQEKYDELKIKMAMHLLEQKELEEAEKEIDELNAQPEYQITPHEEALVMETIDRTLKRQRWKRTWRATSRVVQKVSVFLVVLLIGICTTVISVKAVRVPFINWLLSLQEDSTTIHFGTEGDTLDIAFGYLPDGYTASFVSTSSKATYYSIENETGNLIFLTICPLDTGLNVDTENGEVSEIFLNGKKATSVCSEENNTVVWVEGSYSFILEGKLPLEEIIRIAENITF